MTLNRESLSKRASHDWHLLASRRRNWKSSTRRRIHRHERALQPHADIGSKAVRMGCIEGGVLSSLFPPRRVQAFSLWSPTWSRQTGQSSRSAAQEECVFDGEIRLSYDDIRRCQDAGCWMGLELDVVLLQAPCRSVPSWRGDQWALGRAG